MSATSLLSLRFLFWDWPIYQKSLWLFLSCSSFHFLSPSTFQGFFFEAKEVCYPIVFSFTLNGSFLCSFQLFGEFNSPFFLLGLMGFKWYSFCIFVCPCFTFVWIFFFFGVVRLWSLMELEKGWVLCDKGKSFGLDKILAFSFSFFNDQMIGLCVSPFA